MIPDQMAKLLREAADTIDGGRPCEVTPTVEKVLGAILKELAEIRKRLPPEPKRESE